MILAINPGSTSTKVAVFNEGKPLFELTLRHTAEELLPFKGITEQMEWRKSIILNAIAENKITPADLDAVVGRGGIIKPIAGGVYEVNDALLYDSVHARQEHASNLGAPIARLIAEEATRQRGKQIKAFIADPVVVDELSDVARISGHPLMPRNSLFHALNTKATAQRYARERGLKYEDLSLVIAHMGGGVSVSAHSGGRVIDTTNALSGNGSFSPERTGRVEPMQLVDLCFSGDYTSREIKRMLVGEGGLVAHLGINSMLETTQMASAGDEKAQLLVEAFCYNVSKDMGAMAAAVHHSLGRLDAILITGGIAYNEYITSRLSSYVSWLAEVVIYPGEDELEALAQGVLDVLEGRREASIY